MTQGLNTQAVRNNAARGAQSQASLMALVATTGTRSSAGPGFFVQIVTGTPTAPVIGERIRLEVVSQDTILNVKNKIADKAGGQEILNTLVVGYESAIGFSLFGPNRDNKTLQELGLDPKMARLYAFIGEEFVGVAPRQAASLTR